MTEEEPLPDMTPVPAPTKGFSSTCGAKKHRDPGYCGKPAGWRTDHPGVGRCKFHNGNTPMHREKMATEMAEKKLSMAMKTLSLRVTTNPHDAIMDEICWTAGHVEWLREKVQELPVDQITWGTAKIEKRQSGEFPGTDITEAAQVHLLLDLYMKERNHLVKVCQVAIAAGIEERRVQIAERQGALLAAALHSMLDGLELTRKQQAKVPELMPKMFKELERKWELG